MLANQLARNSEEQACALLGLMHGHFDVPNLNEDVVSDENEPERGIHTGIGIVIPVEKIIETIRHPELVAIRKSLVANLGKTEVAPAVGSGNDADAASHTSDGDKSPR